MAAVLVLMKVYPYLLCDERVGRDARLLPEDHLLSLLSI